MGSFFQALCNGCGVAGFILGLSQNMQLRELRNRVFVTELHYNIRKREEEENGQ